MREGYEAQEVQQLIKKISNGLGHWLTFVTEPDVDSTNNHAAGSARASSPSEDVSNPPVGRRGPDSRDNNNDVGDVEAERT